MWSLLKSSAGNALFRSEARPRDGMLAIAGRRQREQDHISLPSLARVHEDLWQLRHNELTRLNVRVDSRVRSAAAGVA
jgi:hypothetical protein